MLKGVHIAQGFNATLFNSLGNDIWLGTDEVLVDIRNPANQAPYELITAKYVYRIPHDAGTNEITHVMELSNFDGKVEVGNEWDLNSITPTEGAALAEVIIANVLSVKPDAYIILQLASQLHFESYSAPLYDALSAATKARINAVSVHYYPSTSDPLETKQYLRQTVRPFMNARNISDLFLTETGLDAAYFTQEQTAIYIPLLWTALSEFSWLKGVCWYMYQYDNLNYVILSNTNQTKLKPAGKSWRDVS